MVSTVSREFVGVWLTFIVAVQTGYPPTPTRDLLLPPGVNTVWHGAYLPVGQTIGLSQILTFEAEAGKRLASQIAYVGWYQGAWGEVQRQIDVWEPLGIRTHVVWEPFVNSSDDPLTAILNGSQNGVIDDFALSAKRYGKPFFLRFAHEMNGEWYNWSGLHTGRNPKKYVDVWRYVWTRFQNVGATNAIWVWAPNWSSFPDEPWNNLVNYYPGDLYVDWVGVDFFGLRWDDVPVRTSINAVYRHYKHKPIMIAETGTAGCDDSIDGSTRTKDEWITELFSALPEYPQIRAVFWFNEAKNGIDWRVASCPFPDACLAYQQGIASPRYLGR